MAHYGGKDLAAASRTVRKNTIAIAQDIPEDKYSFRAAPDVRSVGEMLAHIALANGFMYEFHAVKRYTSFEGIDFGAFIAKMAAEEKALRRKAQVIELLRTNGERIATWMDGLSDEFLDERVAMPPQAPIQSKSRFEMLLGAKEHEMHHRGQLMLIERQLGIVPHLTREMQARFAAGAAAAAAQK
jgi:uncharacterized damage-inducible protein DinB